MHPVIVLLMLYDIIKNLPVGLKIVLPDRVIHSDILLKIYSAFNTYEQKKTRYLT